MGIAITSFSLLLCCLSLLLFFSPSLQSKPSPYLSPTTLFPNYQKMIQNFKIFVYNKPPQTTPSFTPPSPQSLFYSSLLTTSPFVTLNPNEAHLFFVPFSSDLSTRSIAHLIRDLRTDFPYWNRTLGADHFYMSCSGIGYESDRILVELKKNSVQISCFPTPSGKFIPHKDVTLPPFNPSPLALPASPNNKTARFLGYLKFGSQAESTLVNELKGDPEFLVESDQSDQMTRVENLLSSKFCLFVYDDGDGDGDVSGIGEALSLGCVPAVITDRPIQDLPLLDVVMWSEIAVFVRSSGGGGVRELKSVLASRTCGDRYQRMRELGVAASKHFVWNEVPQPYDAFHMVMYQLWLRRHTIRYARVDGRVKSISNGSLNIKF